MTDPKDTEAVYQTTVKVEQTESQPEPTTTTTETTESTETTETTETTEDE